MAKFTTRIDVWNIHPAGSFLGHGHCDRPGAPINITYFQPGRIAAWPLGRDQPSWNLTDPGRRTGRFPGDAGPVFSGICILADI